MKKLIILAAMALMLVSSSVAMADVVVCEPQPPNHPVNYWYSVTVAPLDTIYDFHVRTFDPDPANYTNVVNYADWTFAIDGNGVHFYGPTPLTGATFVFAFDNPNPVVWADWWTTTNGMLTYGDADINDCSGNHMAEDDGLGYRVHVPIGDMAEDIPTLSQWGLILLGLLLLGAGAMVILRNRKAEQLS